MERIDYNKIATQTGRENKIQAAEDEIARVGYVCLTDAISHPDQCGNLVLVWLEDNERSFGTEPKQRFKIKVRCDAWGDKPNPGDIVERKIMKPLTDRSGNLLRNNVINDMRRRGTFEKQFIEVRKFEVDEKGCIDCGYNDAVFFLTEFGVHFETHAAICGRREVGGSPSKCPDGGMKHVRYWRYEEVPPNVYDKLPSLKRSKKS
jgi:hypothetical protein